MPQGIPTDEETVAKFRALYLYSGNASASGRELDIPDRTARQIAERLEDEPDFAEARRRLRARALDKLVMMRMAVAEEAQRRYLDELPLPAVSRDATVNVVDKRYEDGKLVLDAEKNAQHLAKIEAEDKSATPANVEVHVHLTGDDKDDNGGDSSA
jgi:hypothetical protein